MDQSPLNVRGWVSGLNIFMGFFLSLLGLYGVFRGVTGLFSPAGANVGDLVMCLALPFGVILLRRGIKSFMESD